MERMEDDFLPEIPETEPISEVELLLFLLDGSGSMTETKTPDNRPKVQYIMDILNGEDGLIERLKSSSAAGRFRVQTIYFSENVVADNVYTELKDVSIKNAVEIAGGGQTAIAKAIDKAKDLLDKYRDDMMLPSNKMATAFLITDGMENMGGNVRESANKFQAHELSPILATVGIGKEADEDLLLDIATYTNDIQKRHLGYANVLQSLINKDKLYLRGHYKGILTKEKANTLRQFVYILSKTKKEEKK